MTELSITDVTVMLRLSHELHQMPAMPALRGRRLMETMRHLVDADAAALANMELSEALSTSFVDPPVLFDGDRLGDGFETQWREAMNQAIHALRHRRARRRRHGIEANGRCVVTAAANGDAASHAWLHSFLSLKERKLLVCLSLRRIAQRPFGRRECDVVHAFHTETSWIHRRDRPGAPSGSDGLTPRESETLRFMLGGLGEKQIADEMGLSRNTVHHYVKAIYRHFGVTARGELMARWVGGEMTNDETRMTKEQRMTKSE